MSRLDRFHPPAPFAGTRLAPRDRSWTRRAGLVLALLAASVAVALSWDRTAGADDPDLATLLRVTSATKALIALGAAALVDWRLRHPIGAAKAVAVILGAAAALAGPLLMFGLTAFREGAALHYAGLATLASLAWFDRAAIAALLAAAIEARRRSRAS